MAILELDFEVYCEECGSKLRADGFNGDHVDVEPCQKCIDREKNESYQEGRDSMEDEK